MQLRISKAFAGAGFVIGCLLGSPALAQNAYITNGSFFNNSISVIDTATNAVTARLLLAAFPTVWR